jgi:hypothetical protein
MGSSRSANLGFYLGCCIVQNALHVTLKSASFLANDRFFDAFGNALRASVSKMMMKYEKKAQIFIFGHRFRHMRPQKSLQP